jgi:gliding motility-associated lipoprotein GldB
MFRKAQIYLFFSISLSFITCRHPQKDDVSHIQLEVNIDRFDHALKNINIANINKETAALKKHYSPFYEDYMEKILRAGSISDSLYLDDLKSILTGKPYLDLQNETDLVFPDLKKQENEITDAFKRLRFHFPQQPLPKLYSYISGFQAQTSLGNGYFAIGLDLFLGADSKFYPALTETFPRYISRRFTPDHITPRVIEGLLREEMFPESDQDKTLLSKMIYNGKILCLMDRLLPDVADSIKIGYTNSQLKWARDFEPEIWGYFIQEELLFETDFLKIQRYLTEAPFTPGLGDQHESAPKLAVWTGWQIVKQYLSKKPDITLKELMTMNDAQQILNDSKYRPK